VATLLDSIGYGAVDDGSLADSWRQEPGTPAYGAPYGPFSDSRGTPAAADKVRAALAQATRQPGSAAARPDAGAGHPASPGEAPPLVRYKRFIFTERIVVPR
jgi:hypothetical protein